MTVLYTAGLTRIAVHGLKSESWTGVRISFMLLLDKDELSVTFVSAPVQAPHCRIHILVSLLNCSNQNYKADWPVFFIADFIPAVRLFLKTNANEQQRKKAFEFRI